MKIDTHCHFDMMSNPESYIREIERQGDIVIGMTNAPSHFLLGCHHVRNFKYVRLALGFHPLLAHQLQKELPLFEQLLDKTSYIGEIGLDFSHAGILTKEIQIKSLRTILSFLHGKNKIISVHSRNAEYELLSLLKEYEIKNVIFHWYTGDVKLIPEILNEGYWFSVNEAMTLSKKGHQIIMSLPHSRILIETDLPYNKRSNLLNTYSFLGNIGCNESIIQNNFYNLINGLK
nr:TatD family hydrolase [uncultured Prevotella sp.]